MDQSNSLCSTKCWKSCLHRLPENIHVYGCAGYWSVNWCGKEVLLLGFLLYDSSQLMNYIERCPAVIEAVLSVCIGISQYESGVVLVGECALLAVKCD